jgi:hypothetical protein
MPVPILFLAFADSNAGTRVALQYLNCECEQIRDALWIQERNGQVVHESSVKLERITSTFQNPRYQSGISVFHFGGHANLDTIITVDADGKPAPTYVTGFATFLGRQVYRYQHGGLRLVFLNGCSTRGHVNRLLEAGVPAVVATDRAIDDGLAADFATRFYEAMAGQRSVEEAFDEARSLSESVLGKDVLKARRTREASTSLEHQDEHGWPWALYTHEDWPHIRNATLEELPTLTAVDLGQPPQGSPFRPLKPYVRADAALFAGRDQEIRTLRNAITKQDGPPVVLLYGSPGVGKSSLLEAGLLPWIERNHEIHLTRFPTRDLLERLADAFGVARDAGPAATWRAIEERQGQPFVLIVDRLEQVYLQPSPTLQSELRSLLELLAAAFRNPAQRPQGKLVLAFAKEWFAEVRKAIRECKLEYTDLFLEPLTGDGVREVLSPERMETFGKIRFAPSVIDTITNDLTNPLGNNPNVPTSPTLQVLLGKMWDQTSPDENGLRHFDAVLLESVRRQGYHLDHFVNDQLERIEKIHSAESKSGLVLDLLYEHAKEINGWNADQLRARYGEDRWPIVASIVRNLILHSLLTEISPDLTQSTDITGLSHRLLEPIVRRRFAESSAPGQLGRRILESLKRESNGHLVRIDGENRDSILVGLAGMPLLDTQDYLLLQDDFAYQTVLNFEVTQESA